MHGTAHNEVRMRPSSRAAPDLCRLSSQDARYHGCCGGTAPSSARGRTATSAVFIYAQEFVLGRKRGRREAEDAFDVPHDVFRQHFRVRKETVRWLCDEVPEELRGTSTALSVERQGLCALRFFATGSFQGSVGSEETIGVTQPAVSKCVRRVAEAIFHAGTRNKRFTFRGRRRKRRP
ncbi:hypothetical protein HPB49_003523 [Dermacentor silvarum]|uniref:Uncharacterized protein n=1 Tax=Dermacentor silvarum TaxID=543639 RepID=A0ACB8DU26_DERSI|nr:hypothetical protein HPB49_003523 [Dermacentor silvarum]